MIGFKPTWYAYDQFSFDPLAEFRFPNKEVHLRRVQTVGSPISKIYSREIFSGETPDDPLPEEDPTQLGRYAYFYTDHRYDTSSILKHNGQSLHSYLYDEYGMMYDQNKKPRDSSNFTQSHNFYTFSQKEFDPESSLSYFGARSYDAFSGTWTTQDIVRGAITDPSSLHRYAFVQNNPINLIDRFGFQADPFTFTAPEPSGITIELPEDYDLSTDPFFFPQEPDPYGYGTYAGSTTRFSGSPATAEDLQNADPNSEISIDNSQQNIEIVLDTSSNSAKYYIGQLEDGILISIYPSYDVCMKKERNQRTCEILLSVHGDLVVLDISQGGSAEEKTTLEKLGIVSEFGVGFVPYAGEASDFVECVDGIENFTGDRITGFSRGLTCVSIFAPFIGGKVVRVGAEQTVKGFKKVIKKAEELLEKTKKGGDVKPRIKNVPKGASPIWKDLQPYRGDIKTNGLTGSKKEYYKWDNLHNDIEVFDSKGNHLGSIDPITGNIYKPSKGYKLDL